MQKMASIASAGNILCGIASSYSCALESWVLELCRLHDPTDRVAHDDHYQRGAKTRHPYQPIDFFRDRATPERLQSGRSKESRSFLLNVIGRMPFKALWRKVAFARSFTRGHLRRHPRWGRRLAAHKQHPAHAMTMILLPSSRGLLRQSLRLTRSASGMGRPASDSSPRAAASKAESRKLLCVTAR